MHPANLPPAGRLLLLAVDVAAAPLALAGALALVVGSWPRGSELLACLASAPVAMLLSGAISRAQPARRAGRWLLRGAAMASAVALALLAAWLCLDSALTSWPVAVVAIGLAAAAPIAAHATAALLCHQNGSRRVVMIGPLDCRVRLREHLMRHPELGYDVVAEIGPGTAVMAGCPSHPLDELETAVAAADPDEVLLSTGFDDRQLLTAVMARLLSRPLIVRYVPDPEAVPLFCPRPADLAGLPAIDLSNGPLSPGAELAKWVEDKAVAIIALTILGLPMLVIAAVIKASSSGPVLFIQERHGRGGRTIRVFKFRTMRAEHCTPDVTTGRFKQAEKGDVRVTPFGRFLRNTSLDETPQFLNVLLGDMSVVGPRPHPLALNRRFASDIGELMRRHYVKPGITGLAQISGARGETRTIEDMRRRINFDLAYLRTWSLWLDLSIIARTFVGGWINRQP